MQRSTRWILGIGLSLLLAVVAAVLVPTLAERRAVARLLESGAWVAFESSKREYELLGSYSSFSHDPRLLLPHSQSDADIVELQSAVPAGMVWSVTLDTDQTTRVLLEDTWAYSRVENISLGQSVSDSEAAKLFAAIANGDLPAVATMDCYARIDRQTTLDSLLKLPIKSLLIGCPQILQCDLSAIDKHPKLESLWINEGEHGCDGCENADRYDRQDLKAIASMQQLKGLFLFGLNVTDGMAAELTGATQLEQLSLSQCRISTVAADTIKAALPQTTVTVVSLSMDETADERE